MSVCRYASVRLSDLPWLSSGKCGHRTISLLVSHVRTIENIIQELKIFGFGPKLTPTKKKSIPVGCCRPDVVASKAFKRSKYSTSVHYLAGKRQCEVTTTSLSRKLHYCAKKRFPATL